MAFDQTTRNRLQKFVSRARDLLADEFTRQLQYDYGMDPDTGTISDIERLTHLDDAKHQTAVLLRDTLIHYQASSPDSDTQEILRRIVREQAFTVLNRLCALRMAEARDILMESIANGYQSKGFQLYARVSGPSQGNIGDTYRNYLFSVFDEFALDLAVLFDRYSPMGRLFPKESVLLELLDFINDTDLEHLWAEDETIGWIYQYFNSKEERKKMRDESAAPRNCRELAVRNQFFTPRYVVEFLTDNTLGRIWYEMTQGHTDLKNQCRYLVRRPNEIFLEKGEPVPEQAADTADLTQEELLNLPVYIEHRPFKDPREILMLDPACGSMHFGLYAFDLFETIYQEAWDLQANGQWPVGENKKFELLTETYPTRMALQKDIPRLIIENNIHGIDIDPRAVQIAGLSLWLRAQRSWKEQQIPTGHRPDIQKANIVCAEPMPGEKELLKAFSESLKPRVLGQLVEIIFEKMALAGEAGSLLKIEEEIEVAVEKAREAFNRELLRRKDEAGHLPGMTPKVRRRELFDFADLPDKTQFWHTAEDKILEALKTYAEQAEAEEGNIRRLFTEDVAKGFAFIDLCRKRYDVVLMNPPFGDASLPSKSYIQEMYGDTKGDVYKTFVECFQKSLMPSGYLGIISSRTGFFLGQSADWRDRVILRLYRPLFLADLGYGVLDAMVETAAYVLRNLNQTEKKQLIDSILPDLVKISTDGKGMFSTPKYQKARFGLKRHQAEQEICWLLEEKYIEEDRSGAYRKFRVYQYASIPSDVPIFNNNFPLFHCFRLIESEKKGSTLYELIKEKNRTNCFLVNPDAFRIIPNMPFAYWVSDRIRNLFEEFPPFASDGRAVKQGLATADDFRFLRCWWEVPSTEICNPDVHPPKWTGPYCVIDYRWYPFAKGGEYSPFFADLHLVVNWRRDGSEIRNLIDTNSEKLMSRPQNTDFFYRPGLTWPRRTNGLSFRIFPRGAIFADKGPVVFTKLTELQYYLGISNSILFNGLVQTLLARTHLAQSYEVGIIQSIPVPPISMSDDYTVQNLIKIVTDCIEIKSFPNIADDLSHLFVSSAIMANKNESLKQNLNVYHKQIQSMRENYKKYLQKIERNVALQYQVSDKNLPKCIKDKQLFKVELEINQNISHLMHYLFGRFDISYLSGSKDLPESPDPYEPLPVCSPGMLQNADGLPAEPKDIPADYPLRISWSGIIVDDEGHPDDIITRVRETMEVIWKDKANDIEQEACEILGVRSLQEYFSKPAKFFADHLKRYSKSRRQAPIYWPLSTPSGSYTLWLYYHRLTDQILYTCVNNFVGPKLKQVSDDAAFLRKKSNRTRKQETELESLSDLAVELTEFQDELLRIATFWKPNLNDGVQITAAPLWKLFQYKPWQKKLKQTWKELEKGKYDWAHLAYSIWPERVIRASHKDRSFAIAHDLEEDLWEEIKTGTDRQGHVKTKWVPKQLSENELKAIIQEKIRMRHHVD
jgi:hypothetical protein